MPLFFFNIYNDEITLDHEGIELPDAQAAHKRAVEEVRNLASYTVRTGYLVRSHRIDVKDQHQLSVATVTIGDVVYISDT